MKNHIGSGRQRIAQNIRLTRHSLGYSQEELAERSGLHRTYIGSVERSERNISIDNIDRIARALKIDSMQLLAEIDIKNTALKIDTKNQASKK